MAECLTPFTVKNKFTGEQIPVPCGKCPECLARRTSGWSFRLMLEEERSSSAQFITLTYDTTTVPISKNGFMDLSKHDIQKFFKRLRKQHQSSNAYSHDMAGNILPIRYYCVGEYGGKTKRPHYHIILFNAKIDLLQPAWDKGQIHYGIVTGASIGYTLKYMSKPPKKAMHKNDDRTREFSLMSKGLAAITSLNKWSNGISPTLQTECT